MMPIPTITVCPVCKDPKPSEAARLLAERDRFMDALKQADKRIKGLERDLLIHKERYDRMKIRIQSALGLEPEIASLNDTSLSDLRRNVENSMEQWNRGDALQPPAAAPAPKADAASEGERTTAVDGEQPASVAPVSATPIAARGFAWSNISAAQGIGEPKISNAAWSIADIHERSMGQMKRLALAAVPPKTAP